MCDVKILTAGMWDQVAGSVTCTCQALIIFKPVYFSFYINQPKLINSKNRIPIPVQIKNPR